MVSVAELRAKASKAKDATVSSATRFKDNHTSVPLKNTTWDPYSPQPARSPHPKPEPPPKASALYGPPPVSRNSRPDVSPSPSPKPPAYSPSVKPSLPSRSNSNVVSPTVSRSTPPPVPAPRNSRPPTIPARRPAVDATQEEAETNIDWANLTQADKDVLFSWFDEFFSRFLGVDVSPRESDVKPNTTNTAQTRTLAPAFGRAPASSSGGPPPVATWSRPNIPAKNAHVPTSSVDFTFTMSYPPATTYGSSALDLAHYFHPSTHWDSAWYTSDDIIPPPIKGKQNMQCTGSWESLGTAKTLYIAILFADLSLCWASVAFSTTVNGNTDPNNASLVQRRAEYLDRPSPMSGPALLDASNTYGETIAAFAEGFEGTNSFCARGECWDLANEPIKYFAQFDYVSPPIPSISRTHGHLIFEGKARGKGKGMVGRWRGGDNRVRRGDIVEWRSVRINTVGAPRGSYAILGDPEHTAVITRDSVPCRAAVDGQPLSPGDLETIEVIEQSLPKGYPERKEYDMSAFEEGEMWIYRCVGMAEYLGPGVELVAKPPTGVRTLRI